MVIDNGLCCCNYCGKIRSTVYPYVRRNVCRFNTGYVRLENTKINTTGIYVYLRVPRLLGVLLETTSFNWGTNSWVTYLGGILLEYVGIIHNSVRTHPKRQPTKVIYSEKLDKDRWKQQWQQSKDDKDDQRPCLAVGPLQQCRKSRTIGTHSKMRDQRWVKRALDWQVKPLIPNQVGHQRQWLHVDHP